MEMQFYLLIYYKCIGKITNFSSYNKTAVQGIMLGT